MRINVRRSTGGENMPEVVIRPESPADVDAIRRINVAAFLVHPMSQQTEHLIVDALRESGALEVSLVAHLGESAVGHIAFSKAKVGSSDGFYLLGPVAVLPDSQHNGIGSALVSAGLEELRMRGAEGCVLVGDPGFYGRFGFRSLPGLEYEGVPGEYVLGLSFGADSPVGEILANEAFSIEADDGGGRA
ncbi:MAG TPA: N-acetyltransferase [Coriobacteriia bacterium]|nr:N-acetyltransferase [Coriobacteriia bacterium]